MPNALQPIPPFHQDSSEQTTSQTLEIFEAKIRRLKKKREEIDKQISLVETTAGTTRVNIAVEQSVAEAGTLCNTLGELEKRVKELNNDYVRGIGIHPQDIKVLKEKVDTMARAIANILDLKAENIKAWEAARTPPVVNPTR